MIPFNVQIAESALKVLQTKTPGGENEQSATAGAHCTNNTCKKSDAEECVFHPGNAVFHEGLKYWSCCGRKTTDFTTFLDQLGCTRGKHCWKKKEIVTNAREDWFQRGGQVHITFYCKGALPSETSAKSDGLTLEVTINGSTKRYELFGEIAPSESVVVISERKVEIVLKQVAKIGWPKLLKEQTAELAQSSDCEQQQKQPQQKEDGKQQEVLMWNGLNEPSERFTTEKAMIPLNLQIAESALKILQTKTPGTEIEQSATTGAHCTNNTCKKSDAEECFFHPGNAVFHEGLKYWSCCERKTTDFTSFLDQLGCTRGKHCWKKKEIVTNAREDWFQRGGQVHITIYCKGALPSETSAKSDGLTLEVTINGSTKRYELFGEIAPSESVVHISERKVEIVLKQVAKIGWPKLCYDPPN
ncbi:hypothetical protein niasHT_016888 [Heterodera trifolii]|uniref:Cysteine and histidine-rich domain-containing protein 1 n=1 Tax=Heterodera trifolii TaxID=157864 RepID=A0ABD2KTC7_9BILA